MYNQQLVDKMLEEFSIDQVILYCDMEGYRNFMLLNYHKTRNVISSEELMDFEFDANWWQNMSYELKQKEYYERADEKLS